MAEQIYVALLNEGVGVWRPVPARRVGASTYLIERPADYDPKLEEWEFEPGSTVVCERRNSAEGEILAAVRKVEHQRRTA